MFRLNRPNETEIAEFLEKAASMPFSYPEVGASAAKAPAGYNVDHNRRIIGNGMADFELAKNAVRGWKMFDLDWVRVLPDTTPVAVGNTVAIEVSHLGFYSLNAARIVYVIDEEIDRFGFAYGTLTQHGEIGEERFSVEYHRDTGEVWYDLFAFSRPGHPLARLGYPLSRFFQWQFARDSMATMEKAVARSRRAGKSELP